MFTGKCVTEPLFYVDKYYPSGRFQKKKKRWVYLHKVQEVFWEVVDKAMILSFLKFNIIRKVSDELKWTQLRSFGKNIKLL